MEVASEIGISQAQVSRLEKTALQNLRKHFLKGRILYEKNHNSCRIMPFCSGDALFDKRKTEMAENTSLIRFMCGGQQ